MVQGAGHFGPSYHAEDHLGPARVVELQRHACQHEKKEARHHHQVQEPVERREARVLVVVLVGLHLGLAEGFRVIQVEVDRPDEPEQGVSAEEGEDADEERRHPDVDGDGGGSCRHPADWRAGGIR